MVEYTSQKCAVMRIIYYYQMVTMCAGSWQFHILGTPDHPQSIWQIFPLRSWQSSPNSTSLLGNLYSLSSLFWFNLLKLYHIGSLSSISLSSFTDRASSGFTSISQVSTSCPTSNSGQTLLALASWRTQCSI